MRRCLPLAVFLPFFLVLENTFSQVQESNEKKDVSGLHSLSTGRKHVLSDKHGELIFTGAIVILIATPTLVLENKKVYFGLSRELSLAFGKNAEFRISSEYTFIFRRNLKHQFRAAVKYDILAELDRGEWFSTREFISIGAGYFLDEEGIGIPAEISAGIRVGEESYYLYPYVKLRHTFMTRKVKPDNTDFSLGMAIGYQPF